MVFIDGLIFDGMAVGMVLLTMVCVANFNIDCTFLFHYGCALGESIPETDIFWLAFLREKK